MATLRGSVASEQAAARLQERIRELEAELAGTQSTVRTLLDERHKQQARAEKAEKERQFEVHLRAKAEAELDRQIATSHIHDEYDHWKARALAAESQLEKAYVSTLTLEESLKDQINALESQLDKAEAREREECCPIEPTSGNGSPAALSEESPAGENDVYRMRCKRCGRRWRALAYGSWRRDRSA